MVCGKCGKENRYKFAKEGDICFYCSLVPKDVTCNSCGKVYKDLEGGRTYLVDKVIYHDCPECVAGNDRKDIYSENRAEELINQNYASMPATRDRMIREQRKSSAELRKRFKIDTTHKYIK
jgi:uncharacterized protein CbrC (UPF0167 family)